MDDNEFSLAKYIDNYELALSNMLCLKLIIVSLIKWPATNFMDKLELNSGFHFFVAKYCK